MGVHGAVRLGYHPPMNQRLAVSLPVALLALLAPELAGCGASIYHPRPSPRIQVTSEGSSLVLVKNGRSYGTGIFGNGIEEAVKGNARAEEEAHTYQSQGTAGFVLGLLGSLTSAGGAALLVGNEVQPTPSNALRGGALGMAFGGLALSIVGNVLTNGSQPHLWNAVNLYNDGLPQGYGYPAAYGAPGYAAPGYPAPGYPAPGYPYPGAPVAPGYAPQPQGYAPSQPYAPPQPGYVPPGYAPPAIPQPMAPPALAPGGAQPLPAPALPSAPTPVPPAPPR